MLVYLVIEVKSSFHPTRLLSVFIVMYTQHGPLVCRGVYYIAIGLYRTVYRTIN
jgi:hypothetical protein